MSVREIVIFPDPVLKQVAQPVSSFDRALHKLLDDMAHTMYEAPGVGLAANQVGELTRVAVVDVSRDQDELIELINPEIVSRQGKTSGEEGCLSIPDYRDVVERSERISVKYLDRSGKPLTLEADGLLSVCIQHEIDHLDGVLFVDRLSRLKRELFKKWLKKQ